MARAMVIRVIEVPERVAGSPKASLLRPSLRTCEPRGIGCFPAGLSPDVDVSGVRQPLAIARKQDIGDVLCGRDQNIGNLTHTRALPASTGRALVAKASIGVDRAGLSAC